MAYYPKNKIKTNLSTNGGEFQTATMTVASGAPSYSGYYYKLASGKYYTGKFPGDGVNEELFPLNPTTTPPPSLPKTNTPPLYPTPEDYKNGSFIRYFRKKVNEFLIQELTLDQFQQETSILYTPFSMEWKLTGENIDAVYNINRNMSLLIEQRSNIPGFNVYLNNDYAKYYK